MNNYCRSGLFGICLSAILATNASAQTSVSVSCAAIGGSSITGGTQISIECFITNTSPGPLGIKGGQTDMPNNEAGYPFSGSGSLFSVTGLSGGTANPDGVGGQGPSSAGLSYLFGPSGFGVYQAASAIITHTPGVGDPPANLAVGETRYLGTWFYTVTDCAAGTLNVGPRCSPLDLPCDNIPGATDTTRFRDDQAGPGVLIPVTTSELGLIVPTGSCCDGLSCICDGVGATCCTDPSATGRPAACGGGNFFHPGQDCLTPGGDPNPAACACTSDAQCEDGQFCNGQATCNQVSGICEPGQPPSCPGATECIAALCNPSANGGTGGCTLVNRIAGFPCGDPSSSPCNQPDTCNGNGACVANYLPEGTPCGSPTNDPACDATCDGVGTCDPASAFDGTPCDDELACTHDDACVGGACIGFQTDCDDGVLCTWDTCDNQSGCMHREVSTILCLSDQNCPAIPGVEVVCGPGGRCYCNEVGDCDADMIPNAEETDLGQRDCDGDGFCNEVEIANCPPGDLSCADCNGNEVPDRCEPDCDGDGIADGCEIANCAPGDPSCSDCNGDGVPDGCEPDCDGDGTSNYCEIANCPPGNPSCSDCNNDGVPDGCAPDCDDDGIADPCEIANCPLGDLTCGDCNGNETPDGCELGACCYKPFGSPVCFITPKSGGSSFDPPDSCDNAHIWYPGGAIWYGPCRTCDSFQNTVDIVEEGGVVFHHQVGSPGDCPAQLPGEGGVLRSCTGTFVDPWKSNPSQGTMCHNFGAPGGGPIPAGFFGSGSDTFSSTVCLEGSPLGMTPYGDFGEADTLIRRTQDPFDRCSLPTPNTETVDTEVTALSLVTVSPVIVTYNGSQNPEAWDMVVDLSTAIPAPPPGSLTVTKSHCNGGTYTSVLNVQPRFTFTRVSDGLVRIFDTGIEGLPYITLSQNDPSPWVHDVDPNLAITFDPCSQFHAGIEEVGGQTECDCNVNQVRDRCDIELGTSDDCNLNAIPDSCDLFLCLDDGNPCTDESCEIGVGCTATFNVVACNDSNACTLNDTCGAGHCLGTRIVVLYADISPTGGDGILDVDDILKSLNGFIDPESYPEVDIFPCGGGDGVIDVDDIVATLASFTGVFYCPHPCPP